MSLGPEKIILILVVALIVFGPQRLPEIARQVGAMMRELRRMQDSVRGELEQVLHPDFSPDFSPSSAADDTYAAQASTTGDTDHALPPGSYAPDMSHPSATPTSNGNSGDHPTDDVSDDGFAGPRTFS
jgi:sec-independent protein translocase protein TatB